MSSNAEQVPVVRLTSPGEIAGAIPYLCGFHPQESIVIVSLRGPRKRVGITMRFDLPAPEDELALAREAVARLAVDRADRALAVVCTDQADGPDTPTVLPRTSLVDALRAGCDRRRIEVDDALLVRAGRWWSYVCADPRCCPPDGMPVDEAATSPALGLVAAVGAADGRAVLASREALELSLAPPQLLARRTAEQALLAADEAVHLERLARGRAAVNRELLGRFEEALTGYAAPPAEISVEDAAGLAVSLADVLVRDEVATWALREADALTRLLVDIARRTVSPYDVPVCTVLAWVAYSQGDGGLANVALDRAQASDPTYTLAALLRTALDGQCPPEQIRSLLRATSRDLRRRRRRR